MNGARVVVKRAAEWALQGVLARPRRMTGRSLILAYHNVVPDELAGMGDRSLHLPLSAFRRQLDLLEAHCAVQRLASVLENPIAGDRPGVAITFDDAYVGAIELALPELDRRGLPCTVFVAPGLIGSQSFWWDELGQAYGGLPETVRAEALDRDAGRPPGPPGKPANATVRERLPRYYGCATNEQISQLGSCVGLTFGAHSWTHPNLARLDGGELKDELAKPLSWLAGAPVPSVPILAYPYGLSSATVAAAAKAAGYEAALRVEGGWFIAPANDPWSIPRYNVPAGISAEGFLLRLSGFFLQ